MSWFTFCIPLFLVAHLAITAALDAVSIPGNGEIGTCPAQERRDAAIQNVSDSVQIILQNSMTVANLTLRHHCGAGQWYRVAYLNMSISSQQCPSA